MSFMSPIPWPLFEPDKSPFLFSAGDNLVNCLPVSDGWQGMASLTTVSDPLPSECLGAIYIKDSDNTITIFAGTQTNLYRLNQSTAPYSWIEVSKSTDAYSVPIGDRWSFTRFGDFLVAHNLGGQPQVIEFGSVGNFADLAGAPVAKHSWLAGDFFVFGWLDGQPDTIRWSGLNDHTYWTVGKRGSGLQTFPDGDGVAGGISDQTGATVMFRNKIRRMQAINSAYIFQMADLNAYRGTVAPYSIVPIAGNDFLYLSEDGFFRGAQGQPIGAERVDRWLLDNIDLDYLYDVRGAADPFNKIAWWRFRNSGGQGVLLGYDWQLNRWCYSNQETQHAMPMAAPGVTMDGVEQFFATADDMNVPFDSRLFAGGRPVFAAFTPNNELAFFTGSNLGATIRSSQLELTPNNRTFVQGFRVETDCTVMTGRVGSADFHGEQPEFTASIPLSSRGKVFRTRKSGRLHQFEISIPADESWTVATNFRPDATPEGLL